MKGLPSAGNAAYSDICEYSEQRMTQQFAATVELIRGSLKQINSKLSLRSQITSKALCNCSMAKLPINLAALV